MEALMSALIRFAKLNNIDYNYDDNINTDTLWISCYNLCCNVIVLIYFWIALNSLFEPLYDHQQEHLQTQMIRQYHLDFKKQTSLNCMY